VGFSKARPGAALTLDVADNLLEAGYTIEDGVGLSGEMIWATPWVHETDPSVGESLAVIFTLVGDWPHQPMQILSNVGGNHLSAIGAPIYTPRVREYLHASVSAGQKLDIRGESLDVIASNGRAGCTFYYNNRPPSVPTIYQKWTRESPTTTAGNNSLGTLTLDGAGQIIDLIGVVLPTGTVTADIETAGRFIVSSDSLSPVNEVSWDIDPWGAMEATSGMLNTAQIWRQEVDLTSSVPSVVLTGNFDLDVAITTQTCVGAFGARYLKRNPSRNPLV